MSSPGLAAALHPTERLLGTTPAITALRAQIRHLVTFDTLGSALVPTLLLQGELTVARTHLEHGSALYDPQAHRALALV